MRLIGGAVLATAVLTLAGCGASAGQATGTASSPHARAAKTVASKPEKLPTLREIAAAACGTKRVEVTKHADLQWFTNGGATCGDHTEIAMFSGPGGRDNYASMMGDNTVLMGKNWIAWIDTFDNRAKYRKMQATLGGTIVTGSAS